MAIEAAYNAGIPVVTYDSDAPESPRIAYIASNNYALGRSLGKILLQLRPGGGRYGVISDATPNILTRVEGLRSYLDGSGWSEVDSSPMDCQDDTSLALTQMDDYAANESLLDAIVPVGGWPMFDHNTTRYRQFVDRNRDLTLVVADTLPVQVDLLTNGYVNGLVGQVPYQMGVECVRNLNAYDPQNVSNHGEILGTSVMEFVRVPLSLPEPDIDRNLLGNVAVVGFAVFAVIALTSALCAGWTLWKRKLRIVKASQPIFLVMIAVGTLLMGASVVPLSFDDSDRTFTKLNGMIMCMSVPWLGSIGFTITFSALFSKTWRINKIFHNRRGLTRMRVTERDVMVPFFVLLTLNLLVLLCWTLVAPLQYKRSPHQGTDGWNRVISTYGACRAERGSWPFMAALGAVNLGVLVIANWQAYEARSIQSEFSESRFIAIVMASMLQACISGLPVLFLVRELPRAFYLVLVFMDLIICMAVLLLIFVPKMTHERTMKNPRAALRRLQGAIRKSISAQTGGKSLHPTPSNEFSSRSMRNRGAALVMLQHSGPAAMIGRRRISELNIQDMLQTAGDDVEENDSSTGDDGVTPQAGFDRYIRSDQPQMTPLVTKFDGKFSSTEMKGSSGNESISVSVGIELSLRESGEEKSEEESGKGKETLEEGGL